MGHLAMGTKMGPSYACLFMGHLEYRTMEYFTGPVPELYKRYVDDGFGASSRSESVLLDFIYFVQNFHPSVKFTYNISPVSVEFLDIQINIKHGKFDNQFSTNPLMLTLTCISTHLITLTQKQAFHTLSSSDYEDFVLMMKIFPCNVAR